MRRAGGYLLLSGGDARGDGPDIERDTFSCAHCNAVVVVEPLTIPEGFCLACQKHVCDPCKAILARTQKCVPFERRLEAVERRAQLLRAVAAG